MYDFKFADIGEGIHEGQILKWMFSVGDKVEEGDTLCVIETDKVNAEIPAPVSGVLKKLGAEVGETIHVGETLVLIDDGSGGEAPEEAEKEEKKEEPKKEDTKKAEGSSKTEESSKTEAVSEGDDNASVVGALVVSDDVLEASDEHVSKETSTTSTKRALATPVARKLAKDLGIDINTIEGTGPQGRVMKEDIQKAASAKEDAPAKPSTDASQSAQAARVYPMPKLPTEGTRREKISKLRKAVVNAMDTSNALIPATTVMDEFDVTELVNFRNKEKNNASLAGIKLTYLPLIIKAVVLTLKKYPIFNASFDHETEEIVYKDFYNIGIAVDTEDGLIVPNIKHANHKSILELAKEIDTLATEARDRKLQLSQLQNTTFSITNYGAFGSKLGTPVIKHPEVAILGMGAITKKPVVIDDEIVIRSMFPVSLTIDHRVIDGGDAGRFLVHLRDLLSDPIKLLLS
ncbi:MAG: dihydrolipoamide acetyltransferase family protein [Candidatus Izemoplasmataceae bacterium]